MRTQNRTEDAELDPTSVKLRCHYAGDVAADVMRSVSVADVRGSSSKPWLKGQRLPGGGGVAGEPNLVTMIPDEVTIAMQTGNRIGYHPETARDEMRVFADRYAAAIKASEKAADYTSRLNAHPLSAEEARTEAERTAAHKARKQRALADLNAVP